MIRQETHKGKLIEVWHCEKIYDLKSQLKFALPEDIYLKMLDYCNDEYSVEEFIGDELWDKYILFNNSLYKIEDTELYDYDINEFTILNNSEYGYVNSFYNGGTCLSEILESNLRKIHHE